ncbi:MAG: long-chain fatty acid--CoA ligase [Solirubrobacterales bacterium]|nr:long-chain fatty acid--CoA ligase [Solirubrobacterales bacterium]
MDYSYPLLCSCERNADRVALVGRGGESVTYRELERRIGGLAAGLRAAGLGGARVATTMLNAPETVELHMALARIGAVVVPLNTRLSPAEKQWILRDAGATALVAENRFLEEAGELAAAGGLRVLPVRPADGHGHSLHALRETTPGPSPLSTDGDDGAPAMVIYTSGTTGFPKGVVRSHGANAWNAVNSALGSPRAPGDVELFNLPAFGIGLLHFAMAALLGGATVVMDESFDAPRVWELLAEHRVTRTFLAPTMIDSMLAVPGHEARELPDLEVVYTAYAFSDRLRAAALARFGGRFVFMYGLTEAQLCCSGVGELATKPTSVGRAMGVSRIAVLGPDGDRLPAGETGEIAFEGPSLMTGYHALPEATAATFAGGWMRTGDLGRFDPDGDLHYVGRSKDMIKTGGFSVDPVEVENAILTLDTVAEAAVLGIEDDHWGEAVAAFVVPVPGADVAPQAVVAACRARLSPFKAPKHVRVVPELPKNATGKVERGTLRKRFTQHPPNPTEGEPPWTR